MRFLRIGPALLLTATAGAAVLPDFLPPGTKVVFGISVRGIADSALFQGLASDTKALAAKWTSTDMPAGIDPLKDIDEVLIASTVEGENPPTLIVMRGHFDPARAGKATKRYRDVTLVDDGHSAGGTIAFVDATTAIAGDGAAVRAAIDRRGSASNLPGELAERIQALSGRYEVWGVGDVPPGAKWGAAAGTDAESIEHFDFGASFRKDFEFSGQVRLRGAKDLEKLMTTLQMIEAMMKQRPADGTRIELSGEDRTLKLSLTVPEAEWRKAIEAQKAQLLGALEKGVGMGQAAMGQATAGSTTVKPVITAPVRPVVPTPVRSKETSVQKNPQGDAVTVKLPGGH
jgi:hypothetical protein